MREVELGWLGRMIGMRVVEAEELTAGSVRARLGGAILIGTDRKRRRCSSSETLSRRIASSTRASRAEQRAAAFVRVGGLGVGADLLADVGGDLEAVVGFAPQPVGRVAIAAVREDGDDHATAEVGGDIDRGGEGGAARRPDEQAVLLAPACGSTHARARWRS